MKRLRSKVLLIMMSIMLLGQGYYINADNGDLQEPSELEIIANYQKNSFSLLSEDRISYATAPRADSGIYQVGSLTQNSLTKALNAVNFLRFVAGLGDNLVLNSEYSNYAQHAGYVNMLNGGLSHNPSRPEYLSQSIYDIGLKGAGSSNIAAGYGNLVDSIVYGYMWDDDSYNIAKVGHRRWLLSPQMGEIGFGYVDALNGSMYRSFSATYVMDKSKTETVEYDYLAWPAVGNMPIELMGQGLPWSVNLGTAYDLPSASTVNVTLKNLNSGKVYYFQESSNQDPNQSESRDFFTVNNEGYAMGKCIIFRPKIGDVSYNTGDRFRVTIQGLYRNGEPKTLEYEVDFFSMLDQPSSWAMKELLTAQSAGLILEQYSEDYQSQINRLDFSVLLMNMLTKSTGETRDELVRKYGMSGVSFTDTSNRDVFAASSLGIIEGIGSGLFDPYGLITREAAATMLSRAVDFLEVFYTVTKEESQPVLYQDEDQISSWAKEGVVQVYQVIDRTLNKRVMEGTSYNEFSPKDYYTREQALITMKRLFQSVLK